MQTTRTVDLAEPGTGARTARTRQEDEERERPGWSRGRDSAPGAGLVAWTGTANTAPIAAPLANDPPSAR